MFKIQRKNTKQLNLLEVNHCLYVCTNTLIHTISDQCKHPFDHCEQPAYINDCRPTQNMYIIKMFWDFNVIRFTIFNMMVIVLVLTVLYRPF